MRRTAGPAVAVATLALCAMGLGGCTNTGEGTAPARSRTPTAATVTAGPTSAAPAAARLTIKDFTFKPAALSVRPGGTVTVVNEDSTTHTVTANAAKAFDTGSIGPGRTVTFKAPAKAGSYPFRCTIHPYMKGTLTVR
ncbi:cupredoxin domain-containing protein [Streptomyces sioyaensis]|uniref:cupredoxin domain-containing protein n=1 Tax=Streptomyces sioyaensis TaxID=67364 RepID=UPI0037B44AC0